MTLYSLKTEFYSVVVGNCHISFSKRSVHLVSANHFTSTETRYAKKSREPFTSCICILLPVTYRKAMLASGLPTGQYKLLDKQFIGKQQEILFFKWKRDLIVMKLIFIKYIHFFSMLVASVNQSVSQSVSLFYLISQRVSQSVGQSTSESVSQSLSQSTSQSVSQLVNQSLRRSVSKSGSQSVSQC